MQANYSASQIADALAANAYCLCEQFLAPADVQALRQVIDRHRQQDNFKKAGIGTAATFQVAKEIRGDWIKWVNPAEAAPLLCVSSKLWKA